MRKSMSAEVRKRLSLCRNIYVSVIKTEINKTAFSPDFKGDSARGDIIVGTQRVPEDGCLHRAGLEIDEES